VFHRIAASNRGQPAVRLIGAVRGLDAGHGSWPTVLALHPEAGRRATLVRPAGEVVLLRETGTGSPRTTAARSSSSPASSTRAWERMEPATRA